MRHSPVVRRILLRAALFVVPGQRAWALLPLVASRRLTGAGGTACCGRPARRGGRRAGAAPDRAGRSTSSQLLLLAGLLYAAVLAVLAWSPMPAWPRSRWCPPGWPG